MNVSSHSLTVFDAAYAEVVTVGKKQCATTVLRETQRPDDLVVMSKNRLTETRKSRRKQTAASQRIQLTLLQTLTHELRTPLTLILGGIDLLADNLAEGDNESAQAMLEIVHSGALRMNRVVSTMLHCMLIDSGELEQFMQTMAQPCDISTVVAAAIQDVQSDPTLERNRPSLQIQFPDKPLYVHGLEEYLVMMLAEILRNAFIFSPANASVLVDVQLMDQVVSITITDSGPGIRPQKLASVWERFTQIDRHYYEQQGLGLGLSLARESARLHGGDCTIQSQVGKGTQVTVELPLISVNS